MACTYIYLHTYDIKIGGLNTIGYPIIITNENNETIYTIRKSPSQTESIKENSLDKITTFKIDTENKTIKASSYSLNQDRTNFKNNLIIKLEDYYRETMAKNYASIFSGSTFDINRNKENEIIEKILTDFDIDIAHIKYAPSETSSISEQNPNYYYEHMYFIDTNNFDTNIYKVKSTGTDNHILCHIKTGNKKKVHDNMLDVIVKVRNEHKYTMFSKNADISEFQSMVLDEMNTDISNMLYQSEILQKCIAYNKNVASNISANIKLRTKTDELYEFTFKDGKSNIKTHKIVQADISNYYIERNTTIPKRDINKLLPVPTEWTDKYHVGGVYTMYSDNNDIYPFKKAIQEKLAAVKNRLETLEIPGAKKIKDCKTFHPDSYKPDICNYIKEGNVNSENTLTLYRFIRDGFFGDNRGVKFTATAIPFIKNDQETYTIYEEKDGSICKIPKIYIQNLQTDSNGNMLMWLSEPDFQHFVDRVIIELTSENNAISKFK